MGWCLKDLAMGGLLDEKAGPIYTYRANGTTFIVNDGQQQISQNPDFTSVIKVQPCCACLLAWQQLHTSMSTGTSY